MLLNLSTDRLGSIIVSPVSERWKNRIIGHMAFFGVESDGTVYLQSEEEKDSILRDLSPSKARDLDYGWDVRIRVPDWEALHLWGWDAHTMAE